MSGHRALDELISITQKHYAEADLSFLVDAIYSRPHTELEQCDCVQLIKLMRRRQNQNPVFEPTYYYLLYLYVLNGSRLDLLKLINRRLRGLVDGRSGVLVTSGVSGIGKTSLVLAFQERMDQLGLGFVTV